jgi:pyrimidine-nucleoside phosphorylase
LGQAVGNALEVAEAIATLHGNGPADFQELVETVAVEMLLLGGRETSTEAARRQVRKVIANGAAHNKFREFVAAQGGDVAMVDDPSRLPRAPVTVAAPARQAGYVARIDAKEIGLACVDLGGGRRKKGDSIDARVGVIVQAKVGDRIVAGEPLAVIHAADPLSANTAVKRLQAAYTFSAASVSPLPMILDRIAE